MSVPPTTGQIDAAIPPAGTPDRALTNQLLDDFLSTFALYATSADLTSGLNTKLSTSALAAGILTWLGAPSSANLRAAMTDESGDGTLMFTFASAPIAANTNLVAATHGSRLLVVSAAVTLTVEDDATGLWGDSATAFGVNTSAGVVVLQGDGTATVTAAPGMTLNVPAGAPFALQRVAADTWIGGAVSAGLSNPMTTAGDIIVGGASGTPTRLAAGTNGHVLKLSAGTPAWQAESGGVSQDSYMDTGPTFIDVIVARNTTTFNSAGSMAGTTTGTATANADPFNTSLNLPTVVMTSTAAANSQAGRRGGSQGIAWFAGGANTAPLKFRTLMAANDALSNCRMTVGLFAAEPGGATEPSNLTNSAFFGADTTDANMQVMHNDGSGTCTKVDCGASFPANSNSVNMYEYIVHDVPGATREIRFTIRDVQTGAEFTHTATTNLPATGQIAIPVAYRNTGANTTACSVKYHGMYGGINAGV
jgi:hypothetical protein